MVIESINGPTAWRADQIGSKAGLSRAVNDEETTALEELVAATSHPPVLDISQKSFRSPILEELGRTCRRQIAHGRGAVIITGLDLTRYGLDGYRRIYWYLGQLIGRPSAQSERGDLLGYVRHEKDNPLRRGYISNVALPFHTDFHEVLSLASVATASAGGETGLAPSLAIHNILLAEHSGLLEALYQGWYDGFEAYYKISKPRDELTRELTPYYCVANGVVSFHNTIFPELASEERGEPVPDALTEAVVAVQEIANRPGVAARFILEPGEMLFWHNYAVMHARGSFENAPGRERLLMRLWLNPHEPRPIAPVIAARIKSLERVHEEFGVRGQGLGSSKHAAELDARGLDPLKVVAA